MQPPFDVRKGFPVCNIVNHDDTVGAPVIRARYRPEPLLTRRIPNLQLYSLTVYLKCSYFEVYAYRRNVTAGERIIGKSQEKTALTYTCNIRLP